jgi:hypothetical protein
VAAVLALSERKAKGETMNHEKELRGMYADVQGLIDDARDRTVRLVELRGRIERLLDEIGDPVMCLDVHAEVRRVLANLGDLA